MASSIFCPLMEPGVGVAHAFPLSAPEAEASKISVSSRPARFIREIHRETLCMGGRQRRGG